MRAVGFREALPVTDVECLVDIEVDEPTPGAHDLLVEVQAISVNPVDTKVRSRGGPADGSWRILGWDAAGVVREVGDGVTLFAPGDHVWYAGALERPGTNAQLHCVDERIVGRKPESLTFAAAAALPLTSITAWELLFDRFKVPRVADAQAHAGGGVLLILGAAGGVGSILTQLASTLTDLTVVGTASRPETAKWVKEMGADHVLDHTADLKAQLRTLGIPEVEFVASLTHSDQHFEAVAGILAPQGAYGLIDDPPPGAIDINALKRKSVSVHWEFMFTRSMFATADMIAQHELLNQVAHLVERGVLTSTAVADFGSINAEHLRAAHALLESGRSRGKITLSGF